MTEENWTSESNEAPPKKKGFPKWLMFLGCGCLSMVALIGVGGFFLAQSVKGAADPEVQWPALAEVLPLEGERPDLIIMTVPFANMAPGIDDMWVLTDERTMSTATIYALSGESGAEMVEELLSDEGEVDLGFAGGVRNAVETTVQVQGRELRALRFTTHDPDEVEEAAEDDDGEGFMSEVNKALKKAVIRIEVSPDEGSGQFVLIEYATTGTLEPLTDEQVVEFLEAFKIGPDQ